MKTFYILILILVVGLLIAFFVNTKKTTTIVPDLPTVSPTPNTYLDLMMNKCYNEEEVEVVCKG